MRIEEHITNTKRYPLRYAQARAVGELEHRAVAERELLTYRRRLKQPFDLVHAENFRERSPAFWSFQPLARIADNMAFAQQESEIAADGGHIPPNRGRRQP